MLFSQRQGIVPINNVIQLNSMSDALRNRLWNLLTIHFWEQVRSWDDWTVRGLADKTQTSHELKNSQIVSLLGYLYHDYYKLPLDNLLDSKLEKVFKELRSYFMQCSYNTVYDFIEFIANHCDIEGKTAKFCDDCNRVLEEELSGYRFVKGIISPITSDIEIKTISAAIDNSANLAPVGEHFAEALKKLSDRTHPDYRNSIKESISAVEAMCRFLTDTPKATLGDALKLIDSKLEIHEALKQSYMKAYGYTSDAGGIRHALMEKDTLDFEDAYFMLVNCSAFTNYLKHKAIKAGLFKSVV